MDFLEEIKGHFSNQGGSTDDDVDLKKAAKEAHDKFGEEAHQAHDKPKGHKAATALASLYMMHRYNNWRKENGKKPIGMGKEFLYAIIAVEAEKLGEQQWDKYQRKKHENDAREEAHEIASENGVDLGDLKKHPLEE